MASRDCVCLAVAHSAFDHAMAWLIQHSRLLMDATGVTRFLDGDQSNVIRLGSCKGANVECGMRNAEWLLNREQAGKRGRRGRGRREG